MPSLGYLYPTARVKIQRRGSDARSAYSYKWNRGDGGDGLQFTGTASFASSKDGTESILDITLYNVPRQLRGEVPEENAVISLEVGYEDPGAGNLSQIFVGHLAHGVPSTVGGTTEWRLYAKHNSRRMMNAPIEWTPAKRNANATKQEVVRVSTLVEHFAQRGGIQVTLPRAMREHFVPAVTYRMSAYEMLNLMTQVMSRDLGRVFEPITSLGHPDSFIIVDPAEGLPITVIDPDRETVYDARYEISQNADAETPQDLEEELDAETLESGLVDDETYVLLYKMDLPFRNDVRMGRIIETRDPESKRPVRFLPTSIVYTVGDEWGMSVKGPVEGAQGMIF